MDDILASIRRIIADDDALPLSRSARAAAAPQPSPPAASTGDAFLGLGQRLFRGEDAASAPERRAASAFRPPAPRPVSALTAEAPKAPALKLRDFAPTEPQGARAPAGDSPRSFEGVEAAKNREFDQDREGDKNAVRSASSPVAPTQAPEARQSRQEPEAPQSRQELAAPGASVVPLTSIVSSLAEARLKIAPLSVRAPLVAAEPSEPPPLQVEPQQIAAVQEAPAQLASPQAASPQAVLLQAVLPQAASLQAVSPQTELPPERLSQDAVEVVEPPQVVIAPKTLSPQAKSAPAPAADNPPEAPAARSPRRIPAPRPLAAAPTDESDQPLLSPTSGARIGASFEALTESLMLRDPEMIERVAREILRPMLKSWLDDNLPVVVERLVRAEIERIARGRG